jgi:hypothetical protein
MEIIENSINFMLASEATITDTLNLHSLQTPIVAHLKVPRSTRLKLLSLDLMKSQ